MIQVNYYSKGRPYVFFSTILLYLKSYSLLWECFLFYSFYLIHMFFLYLL